MNKIKMSSGLASVILLAGLFAGWETLLIVAILMFLFCELEDKVKSLAIKVLAFFLALSLVKMGWGLIADGVNVVIASLNDLISVINGYLDTPIDVTKLYLYLLTPISKLVGIANSVILYLITFAKFAFIIATLSNKAMKENFLVKKINEFVAKVVNFINSIDVAGNQAQQ